MAYMANKKKQLEKPRKEKDDEYYTLYEDISAEVSKYKEQLKGKRILCPCDWDESYNEEIVFKEENHIIETAMFRNNGSIKRVDIDKSKEKFEKDINLVKCNFVKFLVSLADVYGIKSISACGYDPATDQGIKFQNVDYSHYDLVITNPPFSQFREFIGTMFKNKMEFLVIGPQTAISYKDVFSFIKNNQLWLGYHHHLTGFHRADGTFLSAKKPEGAIARSCCWFTNLDVSYRHDQMILSEEYSNEKFPKYENYDAIEVNKTKNIPCDYDGCMGVPITFLQKYSPEQFEIIGLGISNSGLEIGVQPYKNEHKKYRKEIQKRGAVDGDLYMMINEVVTVPFARILIRKKG